MAAVTPGEDRVRLLYRLRAHRLLWRMLEIQAIDPAGRWWHGMAAKLGGALARCAGCDHKVACADWLDRSPPGQTPPRFCPNRSALAAFAIAGASTASFTGETAGEPSLCELLDEPIVQQLMAADRVNREILRHALTEKAPYIAAYAAPQLPRVKPSAAGSGVHRRH